MSSQTEEQALVQHIGDVLLTGFASLTPFTLLYGAFLLVFLQSTHTLVQRGLSSRPTQIMFAATLASFLLMSLHWIAVTADFARSIKGVLVDSGGAVSVPVFAELNQKEYPLYVLQAWASQLLFILSDGIVLWRTWVLYWEQRWIMLAPCALLLGTIGTSLAFLALDSNPSIMDSTTLVLASTRTFNAALALSLATNVVSTMLIFYKLWSHLRFKRKMGIKSKSTSPVQKVMIILVESGVVFCAIQAINLSLQIVQPRQVSQASAIATAVVLVILDMATAMYPSIVVLIVSQQRSMVESFGFTTELKNNEPIIDVERNGSARPATPGHLSFAVAPAQAGLSTTGYSEIASGGTEKSTSAGGGEKNFTVGLDTRSVQQTKSAPY